MPVYERYKKGESLFNLFIKIFDFVKDCDHFEGLQLFSNSCNSSDKAQ